MFITISLKNDELHFEYAYHRPTISTK